MFWLLGLLVDVAVFTVNVAEDEVTDPQVFWTTTL